MKNEYVRLCLLALALSGGVSASAQEGASRLSVHGYLSQAWARSENHQILGIPTDGTTDYRRAALLVRYEMSDSDSLVLQFAQRRLGESPVMTVEPDVKVDWAFYEHRFETGTSVRVGRFAQPYGIYNETRYVGTLLPFYRAPYNIYQEGTFTSENVDGIGINQKIASDSDWRSELKVYAGGFGLTEVVQDDIVNQSRAEKAFGAQLWVNTPLRGLRFGASGQRFTLRGTAFDPSGLVDWESFIVSGQLNRSRLELQSEYAEIHIDGDAIVQKAYYVYGGLKLTPKLKLHVQHDHAQLEVGFPIDDFFKDTAVGLSYAFRPDVVAKAEYHWNDSVRTEPAPQLLPGFATLEAPYVIVSLSAAF